MASYHPTSKAFQCDDCYLYSFVLNFQPLHAHGMPQPPVRARRADARGPAHQPGGQQDADLYAEIRQAAAGRGALGSRVRCRFDYIYYLFLLMVLTNIIKL